MISLDHIPLVKGVISDHRYDDQDGILYSYSKSTNRTIQNIKENIALVKKITGNKKIPVLVYLSNLPIPEIETRDFSVEQLPKVYTAMAMVTNIGLSRIVVNMLLKLKTPPIPMKSFTDDIQAREWLKQFVTK